MILNPVVMGSGGKGNEHSINWNVPYDGSYYDPRKSAAAGEIVTESVFLVKYTGQISVVTADGVTIPATASASASIYGTSVTIKFVMPASDVVISDG